MKKLKCIEDKTDAGFDMVRISKSKEVCDVCSNTIRAYGREGLWLYKLGKSIFFSKSELIAFIRANSN
jgi:hypothetical protein